MAGSRQVERGLREVVGEVDVALADAEDVPHQIDAAILGGEVEHRVAAVAFQIKSVLGFSHLPTISPLRHKFERQFSD